MNVSKLFYTFIHKALKTDSSKIFMRLYMPNDWTELMNWFHSILLCDSAACQFRGRKNYFVIYKAHSLIVSSQKRHNSQCQARKKNVNVFVVYRKLHWTALLHKKHCLLIKWIFMGLPSFSNSQLSAVYRVASWNFFSFRFYWIFPKSGQFFEIF